MKRFYTPTLIGRTHVLYLSLTIASACLIINQLSTFSTLSFDSIDSIYATNSSNSSPLSNSIFPPFLPSNNIAKQSSIGVNTTSSELPEIRREINTTPVSGVSMPDCIDYNSTKMAITISCNMTLPELAVAVNNSKAIRNETSEEGSWILNSSLMIQEGATLKISADDGVKTLKITPGNITTQQSFNSGDNGQHGIRVFGSLDVNGTKVISWDPINEKVVGQNGNGMIPRPYIVVEPGADPSSITNSEIAFLGYNSSRKQGLNMYGGEGTILKGNKIHDLWFGFSSVDVGHIIIQNNSIYNNIQYGIDPHSGSHDIIVKANDITNNTNGLVCSKDCYNLVFEENQIHNNSEVGIMFNRNVSDSVAKNNNISDSYIGISASGSHDNNVYENTVSGSRHGLQLEDGSFNNFMNNNTIADTLECGVALSEARNNTVFYNTIYSTDNKGICLSQGAQHNRFHSNLIDSPERYGISIKDHDTIDNIFVNNTLRLADNGIELNNNTDTIFVNNNLYEIKDFQYTISDNSTLNLEKSPSVNHKIRSIGLADNSINIEDSGKVSLVISDDEEGVTDPYVIKTPVHDSDVSPYFKKLSPNTIIEISSMP
jgi:mannuronan 5-epimerase